MYSMIMGPLLSLKRDFEYGILLLVVLDHFESMQLPITLLWYKSLEPVLTVVHRIDMVFYWWLF